MGRIPFSLAYSFVGVILATLIDRGELHTTWKRSRNASAVSDAPHMEWQVDFWRCAGRIRYSCLKEAAGEGALCKFNLVAVMRRGWGIGGGANRSAGRIGWIVVCVRKFEARSLVSGTKGAPRLQVVEGTEFGRS